MKPLLINELLIKKLRVAKPKQLPLKSRLLRLWDVSSLQDVSSLLFIGMTGAKVAQCVLVVSIVIYEAKTVLGLFCLQLNTTG